MDFNTFTACSDLLLLTLPSTSFIVQIGINALALFIAAQFLEGIQIKNLGTAAMVAVVIAFLNIALTNYLEADYGISVSGIANFVVSAAVIMITSIFFEGFKVKGLLWAVILAVVVAFINGFLFKLLEHLEI
ncbi:MAG: putative membrane protein [Polaribacter sp.]|jgi:putative membrane protein